MSNQTDPVVSVVTITYNHAPFIKRCMDGVLMQKTSFPFEYVISEDCSTDGTREIILDYASKNPHLIRVITSDENIGGRMNAARARAASHGKYIASCEGDDYWIDPNKLQKQYDAIIEHGADMVTHNTFILSYKPGKPLRIRPRLSLNESGFLDPESVISLQNNLHLSSLFIRSALINPLPDWTRRAPVGDVPLKMFVASQGKIYYINEFMSVYQEGVPGSFTENARTVKKIGDIEHTKFVKEYLEMFRDFNDYTEGKYYPIMRKRSEDYLAKEMFQYGNQVYINTSEKDIKRIMGISNISQNLPGFIKTPIQNKIVKYLIDNLFNL